MYIENKSFSWLLEMIDITGNDMYMLLKSTCYFFYFDRLQRREQSRFKLMILYHSLSSSTKQKWELLRYRIQTIKIKEVKKKGRGISGTEIDKQNF